MNTQMVRKQIYIRKPQDAILKRLALARRLSEAEIIRQAIDREIAGAPAQSASADLDAMDDFARLALSKRAFAVQAEPYRWDREAIYAEREIRWLRDRDSE